MSRFEPRLSRKPCTKEIGATEAEIEEAASLYLFGVALHNGDLEQCAAIAPQAFALAWEDTTHCVRHKSWAQKLIEAGRLEEADTAVLHYFERLNTDDKSSEFIIKRAQFFARLVTEHGDKLPRATRFLIEKFPAWTEKEMQGLRISQVGRKRWLP